jgi:cytochrome c-type biogenesis protein CcmH
MMLWLVLALMTAAAIFAVLWPLSRRGVPRGGSDVAVYRDQLDEIKRDRAAALIGEREAEAAQVEVSRRLLAAAEAAEPAAAADTPWRRRATALIALVALPLGAASLYLALGSPDLPGSPQAERPAEADEQSSIAELVGRVEAHLEQNPEDGRGWEVIGPIYMQLGRYDDAVRAWRNVLRLQGASAERWSDLGEALTGQANGVVTHEAKEAFDRAVGLNAENVRARYFEGLAAEQDGRPKDAAKLWRELLAKAPADAAWRPFVQESLARVDPSATVPAPRGPSESDVAAASRMSPEQREEMIRGMVAGLAARLQQNGADVEGWLRLIRAYMVLGDKDRAQSAAADARRALGGEPDKVKRVDELVKGLRLEGKG